MNASCSSQSRRELEIQKLCTPLSSNVLPTEDNCLYNKFSSSASSIYKSDCLSTENASFKESLELYNSSNEMHEKRKHFMQSGCLHQNPIHDGSSFDSYENIKFEKIAEKINQVSNHRSLRGKEIYLRGSAGAKLRARHRRGPSVFYYDRDDLSLLYSHDEDCLNNYLTLGALVSSRDEEDQKKSFSSSILPKTEKFISTNESSRKATLMRIVPCLVLERVKLVKCCI
uniref:Uncharacterized protein n=1 Tax=Solanum lycopersicum TaxID=4081 RepID=A0A3Q7ED81_SOLLC